MCVYVCVRVPVYSHTHTYTHRAVGAGQKEFVRAAVHMHLVQARESRLAIRMRLNLARHRRLRHPPPQTLPAQGLRHATQRGCGAGGKGGRERETEGGEGGGSGRGVARVCPVAGTGRERLGERENTCAASSFAARPPHFLASSLPWALFRGKTRETPGQVHTCCRRCKLSASYCGPSIESFQPSIWRHVPESPLPPRRSYPPLHHR